MDMSEIIKRIVLRVVVASRIDMPVSLHDYKAQPPYKITSMEYFRMLTSTSPSRRREPYIAVELETVLQIAQTRSHSKREAVAHG